MGAGIGQRDGRQVKRLVATIKYCSDNTDGLE